MRNEFRPNRLKKIWLKLTDTEGHKKYKQQYSHYKITSKLQRFADAGLDTTLEDILSKAAEDPEINVYHTGNAGDIIYALPVIKKLHELAGKPVSLVLKLDEPLTIGDGYAHPLGSVMLNKKMVAGLAPLLKCQSYINNIQEFSTQKIHLDLTLFRKSGLALDRGDIARWNFFTTGITANLSEPWLTVKPNTEFAGLIVLSRSSRYNNALVDYSFLSAYKNIVFAGVEPEFLEMKKSIPGLEWKQVNDFLELAEMIAGCKLFIGNQSFPFALAEGLKVKRLLEVFYKIPNVMPAGNGGYEFCFQKHFEWLVSDLTGDKAQ